MWLFLKRFCWHSFIFLYVLLPLQLIGAVILLFALPFISADRLKLPWWLRWFDKADPYVGRDTSVYEMVCQRGWWSRYVWLAWRNPINYFGYVYMGLEWNGHELYLRYDPVENDIGDTTNKRPGLRRIEVIQTAPFRYDFNYYEYYWIYRYPFAPHVCFRFRMGWKISDMDNPAGTISQWVFVISPWKKYSGK